jgi:S-adenosyl-L-methionine hydrolase (adenosine-forming)
MRFAPNGIITLTTDFGTRDPFVGVMKGRILARLPGARIVDLTHEIAVFSPAEAGFWLSRSFEYFPPGTIHLALVDPGVGTERAIVILCAAGQLFLAPDNGLLAPILARHPRALLHRLDEARLAQWGLATPSATFHGRDIFAPLAAEIAAGRCDPEQLGPNLAALTPSSVPQPQARSGSVSGVVVKIDRFGNIINNIDAALLECISVPEVCIATRRLVLQRTYGQAPPGEYLALVNAFGVLEVARAAGDAAASLGIGRGAAVTVQERGKSTPDSN